MSLFFITGVSGSGKSAVCQALQTRGLAAYDTDEDGLAKWQHHVTGYIHPKSSVKAAERTADFLKQHAWNVQRSDIEALALAARTKPVFLTGIAFNSATFLELFTKVFLLTISQATLKQRLLSRETNDWGRQPHEVEHALQRQTILDDYFTKAGATLIDANQPLEAVVDSILNQADL